MFEPNTTHTCLLTPLIGVLVHKPDFSGLAFTVRSLHPTTVCGRDIDQERAVPSAETPALDRGSPRSVNASIGVRAVPESGLKGFVNVDDNVTTDNLC